MTSLMLSENLINLAKDMIERDSLRNYKISLVISWLGTRVAKALIMNASRPTVGWK